MLLLDVQVLNSAFNFEPYAGFTKNVQKKVNSNRAQFLAAKKAKRAV